VGLRGEYAPDLVSFRAANTVTTRIPGACASGFLGAPPPVRKPQARARGIRPATLSRFSPPTRPPPVFPSLALRAFWGHRLPSGSPKRERGEYGPPRYHASHHPHARHPYSRRWRFGLFGGTASRQEVPSASAGNTDRHAITLLTTHTPATRIPVAGASGFLGAPPPVRKPQARARGIRPRPRQPRRSFHRAASLGS
jgi:hypothetical protein